MKNANTLLKIVAVLGAVAIVLAAIGAHSVFKEKYPSWATAVQYHFIHTLVLLALYVLALQNGLTTALKVSVYLFLLGLFLFSGSIYFLGIRLLYEFDAGAFVGKLTPIGGITLILAWLSLLFYKK